MLDGPDPSPVFVWEEDEEAQGVLSNFNHRQPPVTPVIGLVGLSYTTSLART